MSWILPDGKIVTDRGPKFRPLIGDVHYSRNIFTKWSAERLAELGIYTFVGTLYNSAYYNATAFSDSLVDTTITRTYVLENKFTSSDLRQRIIRDLKSYMMGYLRHARQQLDYLAEFEPNNDTSNDEWVEYIAQLKVAAQNIRDGIQAITSYSEGVEFITTTFKTMLPEEPAED
jgi:hypothetical protein